MKKDWEIKSLVELEEEGLIQLGRGVVISKKDLANIPGDYPVYSSAQLNNGVFGRYGEYKFDEELITWSVDGGGSLFYRTKHKFSITNVGGFCRILRADVINYKYLYFILTYLHSTIKFDWVKKAHPSILRKEYKTIPLPPLLEQKRIVSILDKLFADLEKANANAEQNLKNSKKLFEVYLQNIFENSSDDWKESTLGEVYDVRDGTHDSPKYQEKGFALITSKNLKNDSLNYKNVGYISEQDYININKRSKVDKGDILFAMIGTIGNSIIIKNEPNFAIKNVALFKVPGGQDSNFLKYYLDTKSTMDKMMADAKGATQKFVGLGYLRNFTIKLPSLKIQKSIAKKVEEFSVKTKKLEAIYQKKKEKIEKLKKSVLQKAFSGKL